MGREKLMHKKRKKIIIGEHNLKKTTFKTKRNTKNGQNRFPVVKRYTSQIQNDETIKKHTYTRRLIFTK